MMRNSKKEDGRINTAETSMQYDRMRMNEETEFWEGNHNTVTRPNEMYVQTSSCESDRDVCMYAGKIQGRETSVPDGYYLYELSRS